MDVRYGYLTSCLTRKMVSKHQVRGRICMERLELSNDICQYLSCKRPCLRQEIGKHAYSFIRHQHALGCDIGRRFQANLCHARKKESFLYAACFFLKCNILA